LLDDGRHRPREADSVTAHDERLLPPVLVQKRRAERLRVEGAELEDVADLDRGLDAERSAALGAGVAVLRLADVGEGRLVVTARLDAAEVPAVLVGAGDVLAVAECRVGDDLDIDAHRAERAASRSEGG